MAGVGRKPRRSQAEINEYRRRSLIEGTIRLLAERGVKGATVRSITATTTGSRGLVNHYYKSKEELLAVAFRHLINVVDADIVEQQKRWGRDPVARLKGFPRTLFSNRVFTKINRNAYLTFWHEIRFNPAVRRENRKLYRSYTGTVEKLFKEAAAAAGRRIDWRRAARGLIALIDGLWLEMSIDGKLGTTEQAIEICIMFIDQQLAGPTRKAIRGRSAV